MTNHSRQTRMMIPTSRIVSAVGGAAALSIVFGMTSASAGESCAAYGPGFTKVEGSETCIHIGGHVRVEAAWDHPPRPIMARFPATARGPASLRSSSDDTTNTIGGAGLGRSHLRLPQGAIGYADSAVNPTGFRFRNKLSTASWP